MWQYSVHIVIVSLIVPSWRISGWVFCVLFALLPVCLLLVSHLAYMFILKMEAVCYSQPSKLHTVTVQEITLLNISISVPSYFPCRISWVWFSSEPNWTANGLLLQLACVSDLFWNVGKLPKLQKLYEVRFLVHLSVSLNIPWICAWSNYCNGLPACMPNKIWKFVMFVY